MAQLISDEHPLRIEILTPDLRGGGAEFVALQWAIDLCERGHAVTVLATEGEDGRIYSGRIPVRHVRRRFRGYLGVLAEVRKEVKKTRPDVLISLMPFWNISAIAAGRLVRRGSRPRVFISEHNLHRPLRDIGGNRFRAQLALARIFYRFADGVIAVSHPVAAEISYAYNLNPQKLWVIPNPAAQKIFDFPPARPLAMDGAHVIRLVFAGRFVTQKRPELVIVAAASLLSRSPVEVHFFGEGPLENELRRRASELGVATVFHGWVERWFDEAPADAVVVLPSLVEGFGNILVEAAAVGLPAVVSSRALGVVDACVPNVSAILIEEDSPIAFADGVLRARGLSMRVERAWLERYGRSASGAALERMIHNSLRQSAVPSMQGI